MGWAEIETDSLGSGARLPSPAETVLQVWQANNSALATLVQMGYRSLISANWYLNNGGSWTSYYHDDPMSHLWQNATAGQKQLVLGGEACMWNSAFDAHSNSAFAFSCTHTHHPYLDCERASLVDSRMTYGVWCGLSLVRAPLLNWCVC